VTGPFDTFPVGAQNGAVGSSRRPTRDLTVVAVPFYFATMAVEHLWLRRRAATRGTSAGNYERRDTIASLSMGVGSLLAPMVMPRLLRPFAPGRGRLGKIVLGTAAAAAVATTAADIAVRRLGPARASSDPPGGPADRPAVRRIPLEAEERTRAVEQVARRVASIGGVTAVVAGGVAVATVWAARTAPEHLWRRRLLPSLGNGPLALAAAVAGWDFIYYWNHRFMHQSRYMWAVHVVHHSSEHYNLSTALRQPVADALGTGLPYGALCLLGIPPELVKRARDINLLYQYWIHTETLGRLGPVEAMLNTPSHHRVHHGSNRRYLDRNHGSILIVWDKLFGTFEPEIDPVVYGLTQNIGTFNLSRIASHEYMDMLRDVAGSSGWSERLSFVLRGPGWAKAHRAAMADGTPTRADGGSDRGPAPAMPDPARPELRTALAAAASGPA